MLHEDLTPRQEQLLQYIEQKQKENGYVPTMEEIMKDMGLKSKSTVHFHMTHLEEKGYIKRDPYKHRKSPSINKKETSDFITDYTSPIVLVPVVGEIAAGSPLLAEENVLEQYPIPTDMIPNEPVFMLVVKGDSMTGVGIMNGDKLLIRQTRTAENGDIVAAMIDGEATVKTFYKEENGDIRLQPENPLYEPIVRNDVTILGVVIGDFRTYR